MSSRDPVERCQVAVVVPALNEESYLESCLEGLLEQRDFTGAPLDRALYMVVVVDNGSTDRTAPTALSFSERHPDLHLTLLRSADQGVARTRKTGFDWALDRLAALGRVDEVMLASTDADTIVHENWISAVLRAKASGAAYAGGAFSYPEQLTRELTALQYYNRAWSKVRALLEPITYIETPGSNFALSARSYVEIGGMPLFSVGEDLAVAEMLIAQGHSGVRLGLANRTSHRRAACDPIEFLTGAGRLEAWGSHGRRAFQPQRACPPRDMILPAFQIEEERRLLERCLTYFTLQHIIKPLVLVPSFRPALLSKLAPELVEEFERVATRAEDFHPFEPVTSPFCLEDRVLEVDQRLRKPIVTALRKHLRATGAHAAGESEGIAFHCAAP